MECDAYRNARGDSALTVGIRNSTDATIYVQPYLSGCNDTARLVRAFHQGREVFLQRVVACGAVCQDIQDDADAPVCITACSEAPLIRIESGGVAMLGPLRSQFVSHGLLSGTLAMPRECVPGERDDRSCQSEAPLEDGVYELHARARLNCESRVDGSCECVKSRPDGTCQTGAFATDKYGELPDGIAATATVDLAEGNVTLVFQ
jgi:hypothetical protein